MAWCRAGGAREVEVRYDEAQQVRYHPGDGSVIAKVVVIKVQSNYNNVAANRLGVVPDTTDVAG